MECGKKMLTMTYRLEDFAQSTSKHVHREA